MRSALISVFLGCALLVTACGNDCPNNGYPNYSNPQCPGYTGSYGGGYPGSYGGSYGYPGGTYGGTYGGYPGTYGGYPPYRNQTRP